MNHALKVLEFDAVRERLAFHCETSIGAESALGLQPAFDSDSVWDGFAVTGEACRLVSELPLPSIGAVRDLREALEVASKGGSMGGVELFHVAESLSAMRSFRSAVAGRRSDFPRLWVSADVLADLKPLEGQIFAALDGGGEVRDGASPELARIRQRKRSATSRILERIQSYTSGRAREFLSDPIYTVRDGRYVVPVKVEYRAKVKGIVHDTSGSGQTLFVEPEDVLQLGNALRELEVADREEVRRILAELSEKVGLSAQTIAAGIEAAGALDFLLAKARLGFEMKAVVPQRWQGSGIVIERGRHPLIESGSVVPIDISVGFDFSGLLITGPNTGGKTVAIKTVGLFVLMAQSGLLLPAGDVKLGTFTQVWADIGDEQSLQQSLSTFSGHIKNIAEALKGLKPGALLLFDEIGAGTDPAEGAALAKGILTTLQDRGAYVVASTHYGELKAFAYNAPGFRNAAMEFDLKSLRPTYRVLMGAPGASHALRIAERYGLPSEVVDRARDGLSDAVQQVGKMLEQLEISQKQARTAQSEADRRAVEVSKVEEKANRKLAEAEVIRQSVHATAAEAIQATLREIREEAARIFEDLKREPHQGQTSGEARRRIKELQKFGSSAIQEFSVSPVATERAADVKKGGRVKVEGYQQPGVALEEPRNGRVLVQIGALKVNAELTKVHASEEQNPVHVSRARPNIGLQRAQTAVTELHLRAMRAEDAILELERFVDDAVLAGAPFLRIVHGKGEGILRKITQDILRKNPNIARFRDGEASEGGHGVTVAYLK